MNQTRLWLAIAATAAAPFSIAAPKCNPASIETCALPFPSDYWSTSVNGEFQLQVENDVVRPEILAALPVDEGFSPSGIFNGDSGYSAGCAALFEFENAPDTSSLPADGGTAVMAYDLTAGELIPVRTSVNEWARSRSVASPSQVVEVFAQSRWPFEHEILVVVTRSLQVPGEQRDLESQLKADGSAYSTSLLSELNRLGLNPDDLWSATKFTVRKRSEVLGPIQAAVDDAYNREHPVRNIRVSYNFVDPDIAATVTGEVRSLNYRTKNGQGQVDFSAEPFEQWITFRMTLPSAAREGYAPVALYAHGLGASKSLDSSVTDINSDLGIATYGVDFPNHGSRTKADGGGVFANLNVEKIGLQAGMVNQAPIDFASAQKALQTALADLDVVGKPSWRSLWGNRGDGVPDLDPRRIMMQGTSLGGVLGGTYAALSPDLAAGLFQVTGSGITSILSASALWDGAFDGLVPEISTGAEGLMLRSAVQQELDPGDSLNSFDLMRYPLTPRDPRPVLITSGANDGIVGNFATVATATLLNMPQVGPKLYEMPGIPSAPDYDQGYGVRHYKPVVPDYLVGEGLSAASAHLIFISKEPEKDEKAWLERFFLNR